MTTTWGAAQTRRLETERLKKIWRDRRHFGRHLLITGAFGLQDSFPISAMKWKSRKMRSWVAAVQRSLVIIPPECHPRQEFNFPFSPPPAMNGDSFSISCSKSKKKGIAICQNFMWLGKIHENDWQLLITKPWTDAKTVFAVKMYVNYGTTFHFGKANFAKLLKLGAPPMLWEENTQTGNNQISQNLSGIGPRFRL